MSTDYIPHPNHGQIPFDQLRELNIRDHGIEVCESSDNDDESVCLTDGTDHLWAYGNADGTVHSLTRYGANDVEPIINQLSSIYGCWLVDEYDDEYQRLMNDEWEDEDEDEDEEIIDIATCPLGQEYYSRNRVNET